MINQISPVKTKTEALPHLNKGLIQARHIQAQVKERVAEGLLPGSGLLWSPITVLPYFVSVSRRVE